MRRRRYSSRLYDGQSTRWVCGPQNEPVCQKAPSVNGVIVGDWVNASDQNDTGCQRAPKKPCAGAGTGRRSRRRKIKFFGANMGNRFDGGMIASPMFDYIVETAQNGQKEYFGAIVNGDQEILTPIEPQMFVNITGQPDTYSKGNEGVFRYRADRKWGKALRKYNRAIAAQKGYPESAVNEVLQWLPARETALAFLLDEGVPVRDENDLFEIFGKFHYYHPTIQTMLPDEDYNLWSGYHTQGRNENNFDWGGMITGVMQSLSGMVNATQAAAAERDLQMYVNNFANYMQTDFAVIQRDLQEKGPQAALNALLSYKNGSWKELIDFIRNFASQHGFPIPAQVSELVDIQIGMENDLRMKLASGEGAGTTPVYTPGGNGTPNPPGPSLNIPSFDFKTMLLIILGIAGFGFVMKKV